MLSWIIIGFLFIKYILILKIKSKDEKCLKVYKSNFNFMNIKGQKSQEVISHLI